MSKVKERRIEVVNFYQGFKDGLNIFTDASMMYLDDSTSLGCPGYICVSKGNIIEQDMTILYNTTVNNAELYGILMGVYAAIKRKNDYQTIRIFSDSQLSIFAIRDRIFNWVKNDKSGECNLVGSDNQVIKNQNLIMEIIYAILYFNLHVEFYHQKGHVEIVDKRSMAKATKVFCTSNGMEYIDPDIITTISMYNNYVDNITRQNLKINYELHSNIKKGLIYEYFPFDVKKYQSLINKKGE